MEYTRLTEAARLARIPERTLRRLVNTGRVRHIKVSPRLTLVHLRDACDNATGTTRLRTRLRDLTIGR